MNIPAVPQGPEVFPGLSLLKDEHVLLTGAARKQLRNPLQPSRRIYSGFVLTDRRLVMLTAPTTASLKTSHLTSMPLSEITCVQATDIGWNLSCVLGLILGLLFYIIPGVLFLFYMSRRTGLWLVAHTGGCSHEIKFGRESAPMLSEVIELVHIYRQAT